MDAPSRASRQRGHKIQHLLTEARAQVLVARADGQVQGFIAFGPSRDADAPPTTAEVWAFYLAPSAWSRGWGRKLWLAARAQLQARAYASVRLWVLAANARAILFYAAAGFAPEAGSARELSMGGVRLRELRCACRIDG
jgi:ribosomal protein S18 acetylase RimI-like enzyme